MMVLVLAAEALEEFLQWKALLLFLGCTSTHRHQLPSKAFHASLKIRKKENFQSTFGLFRLLIKFTIRSNTFQVGHL